MPDKYNFQILNHIEENPDTTQADLATQLGVAVGSVNWYIKRLINKGHVKVTQMQRRRLRYLLTPQGIAENVAHTDLHHRQQLDVVVHEQDLDCVTRHLKGVLLLNGQHFFDELAFARPDGIEKTLEVVLGLRVTVHQQPLPAGFQMRSLGKAFNHVTV